MEDKQKDREHQLARSHQRSKFSSVGFSMARGGRSHVLYRYMGILEGKFNELNMTYTHNHDHSHSFKALTVRDNSVRFNYKKSLLFRIRKFGTEESKKTKKKPQKTDNRV